jgi:hypothetical protein
MAHTLRIKRLITHLLNPSELADEKVAKRNEVKITDQDIYQCLLFRTASLQMQEIIEYQNLWKKALYHIDDYDSSLFDYLYESHIAYR